MKELFGYPQVIAFAAVFILSLAAGPLVIPLLKKLNFGQTVREDGPETHLKKQGTPIMGGFIFLIPLTIAAVYFGTVLPQIIPMLLVTLAAAAVGFIDDFIKAVRKNKDGLNPRQKTIGIILISLVFSCYSAFSPAIGTGMIIPFMGLDSNVAIPVWLYIPFITVVMYLIINSVNMTDGVDGLAGGVTLIVMLFFAIAGMARTEWDFSTMFCAMTAGGCLGFLAFNLHPAKVFMGDTGSLGLGAAVGAAAVMMRMPWILLVVGGIYAAESLSVFIQVTYYKRTKKRVFKMAPIHHHFEKSGWKETKVVAVFWTVTLILCVIGFLTLRFRFF